MRRCGGGVIDAGMWRMGYRCEDVEEGLNKVIAARMWRRGYRCEDVDD